MDGEDIGCATTVESSAFGKHYDAVIVGAGVGGLVCGCLLAKEGLKILVIERHSRPGGFATSFQRKGYSFQIPRLIGGLGPRGGLRRICEHLGLKVEFHKVDPFMRFIYPDHDIAVPCNPETYKEVLKENFLPQTENLNRFFKIVAGAQKGLDPRRMRRPLGPGGFLLSLSLPFMAPRTFALLLGKRTYQDVLDHCFTNDMLKAVLASPWPQHGSPPWELSALAVFAMMETFSEGAFFPVGGFSAFAEALAGALAENGGETLYEHEVTSINTAQGRVSEVETFPRNSFMTGAVVSDADTKRTFLKLADRENFTRAYLDKIDGWEVSMTGFLVQLGMRKLPPEDLACGTVFAHPSYDHRAMVEELSAADRYPDPSRIPWSIEIPSMYDHSLAPDGCCCMNIAIPAVPYRFMHRWGVEPGGVRGEKYRSIKDKYAEVAVNAVSRLYPDLINNVEAYDIASPITFERYTMAIDGCWYDSAAYPDQFLGRRTGPRTPLQGLYITGAKSVLGGGIHASAMSGLIAADSILKGGLRKLFTD